MRAVTFQEPGRVAIEERPDPEPLAPDDAVVRVDASGICGSDLHIFHGRVQIEPGFTIGHEYVGTVVAAGDGGNTIPGGGRVPGTLPSPPGPRFFCRKGAFPKCAETRVFRARKALGALPGAQGAPR